MAASPLFSPDIDQLKRELRLSGLPAGGDAQSVFELAILNVKMGFYRELTKAQCDVILATPYVDNPTTDAQVLRAVARVTEVLWMRWDLMGTLPQLFMDASGDSLENWQNEAAFRQLDQSTIEDRRSLLWTQIKENLDLLSGAESIGDETSIRVSMIGGDEETLTTPGSTAGILGSET